MPVIMTAIESPTHSLVDAALRGLPSILPVLDFSTIKNELFPVIAAVFSKTSSLQIKIRGLRAFVILCGGTPDAAPDDGLDGLRPTKKTSSSSALDKYTMQEKIVPLVRAIKTKEPAVMMAALEVLKVVGETADIEFAALEILPILWSMGLGPLLSLQQFQSFMELIRSLSRKVEEEHASKLQELSGPSNGSVAAPSEDFVAFGGLTGTAFDASGGGDGDDFEALVKGRPSPSKEAFPSWDANPPSAAPSASTPRPSGSPQPPAFSWSTPTPAAPVVKTQQASTFRTVTPDLSGFGSLAPTSTQFSQPLQPQHPQSAFPPPPSQNTTQGSSVNWSTSTTSPTASNPWASGTMGQQASSAFGSMGASMNNLSLNTQRPGLQQSSSSLSLPPPPGSPGGLSLASPPGSSGGGNMWSTQGGMGMGMGMAKQAAASTTNAGMGMGMGMAKQAVTSSTNTGMGMAKQAANTGMGMAMNSAGSAMGGSSMGAPPGAPQSKSGLDKYQSLL